MDAPLIIYEDRQIMLVFKPAGWLSQADGSGRGDVLEWARARVAAARPSPGRPFVGLCHRLDLPVGGVTALARTSKAAGRIAAQFRDRELKKVYLALVGGRPAKDEGVLAQKLARVFNKTVPVGPGRTPGAGGGEGGDRGGDARDAREGVLSYRLLETGRAGGRPASVLLVDLLTGFKHQIRAQLADASMPVWGDALYGAEPGPPGESGIGLFAGFLTLRHPVSRRLMEFWAEPRGWPWSEFRADGEASGRPSKLAGLFPTPEGFRETGGPSGADVEAPDGAADASPNGAPPTGDDG